MKKKCLASGPDQYVCEKAKGHEGPHRHIIIWEDCEEWHWHETDDR
jgi:hypothetical protein